MSTKEFAYARSALGRFIGGVISRVALDEFHLELVLDTDDRFLIRSAWRVIQDDSIAYGSGDVGGHISDQIIKALVGLTIKDAQITDIGDTSLVFGGGVILQALADSVEFETWEAHSSGEHVIFQIDRTTTFPRTAFPRGE